MIAVEIVFWVSVAVLAWTHVLYPAVARGRARVRTRPIRRDDAHLPTVALTVAAYNEEPVVERRIANLRALDYPPEKLEHEAVAPDTPVAVEPAPVPRSVVRDGLGSLRRTVGRVPGLRPFYLRLRPLPIVVPQDGAAVAVKAEPVSGPSGPFGDNTPGDWLTLDQAAYAWLRTRFEQPARSWYDFHARL